MLCNAFLHAQEWMEKMGVLEKVSVDGRQAHRLKIHQGYTSMHRHFLQINGFNLIL